MKKLIISCLLSVLLLPTTFAQYETTRRGYEGDYFSLEGAIDLFKRSNSLRDFERKLNTEENWVNNLDLNYDGRIDYIRVEHRRQGNYHAVILQAVVDRYDIQDVAVIEIEITGRREAVLQIIGDEDLYGEEVIVEPVEGYSDSRRGYRSDAGDYVNVYYWEPVQYILGRQYRVYVSPYRWQYYPTWWSPWRQCTWSVFRPRIVIYHRHYHVVNRLRVIRVHNFYRPYRSYSQRVVQRTNEVRVRHGKPAIHRPAPVVRQDGRSNGIRSRNNVVERPRNTTPPGTAGQSPAISRKRTLPAAEQNAGRNSVPRVDQKSRNGTNSAATPQTRTPIRRSSVNSRSSTPAADQNAGRNSVPRVDRKSRNGTNSSATPRTRTPIQRSSVNSRSSTPAAEQRPGRRSAPQFKQPSRSTTPRSRTNTPSATPTRRSSTNSGTAPSAKTRADRSTPARVYQPSRNKTARPSTTTRSTTPARKPSASSSSRAGATSKPKATRSATSKSSSSRQRSRSGGGE